MMEGNGGPPYLHFPVEEYLDRVERARKAISERGLDGLLLFKIEDMYWLTGLDTDGYYVFHCMYVGADGHIEYLTRGVDYSNVTYSSTIKNCRLWAERSDVSRSSAVLAMLLELGLEGRRIGVQLATMGMRADLYRELLPLLEPRFEIVEASDVIGALRRIKSPAEVAYMRRAAEICRKMRQAALALTRPGAFEGDILAEMASVVYRNDGDPSALRFPVGSGRSSYNARYTTARRTIGRNDHVMYEIGCGYRHYHAATYFIALTGPNVDPRHRDLLDFCHEVLDAAKGAMKPGNVVGDIHHACRTVYEKHGRGAGSLKSFGYNMGATFPPTWVDPPMVTEGESTELAPGMVFFLHPAVRNVEEGLRMAVGEQLLIGEHGVESITRAPRELDIC